MKPGDRVRILNEAATGQIVRIENKRIVVDVDGFEYSYNPEELIIQEMTQEFLEKLYAKSSPAHKVKPEDRPKQPEMSTKEKIEELGRVRGKRNSKGILEFDLHIHDLLVKHDHMTPGEMLNYQLDYAVHCLEESIKSREASIVFIHGVGKGVLRVELHRIIKAYGFSFHDGFMQEYGVGATRVELRGN